MGLSMLTALEIFTNPRDLEIIIGSDAGKYGFAITRGPGHDHKVMVETNVFAKTQEDAVEAIKGTLESICEALKRDFADLKSFPSQYLNPDGQEIDPSKVLNPDLINRIIDELRQHQVAGTYKMLAPAG